MNTTSLQNSIFTELMENLLQPDTGKIWLQKIANLLRQFTNAKGLILHVFTDNSLVISGNSEEKKINNRLTEILNTEKPFWISENYIVPLEIEGYLEVNWERSPSKDELNTYNIMFLFLTSALRTRAGLSTQKLLLSKDESLSKFESVLNTETDFKAQIDLLAKEISLFLDTSRCQIKFFCEDASSGFNGALSAEFVKPGFVESVSVVPSIENEWLQKIRSNQLLILNNNKVFPQSSASQNIESLLSIKSILGYPLIYKNRILGVLVLHQCDYERIWKTEEIQYLRETALFLSALAGKEFELKEEKESKQSHLDNFVINSDEFLKELNHLQIDAQINNSCFSLIMIDIE